MKCLQVLGSVIFVASSASTVYGGAIDTTTHGTSYGLAAPAMVSYGISHAAPATVSYGAAPAVSVAAAPVAHASARSIRSHEIHTGGSANQIRVEEYKAGGQLIRVHDAPQTDPEVINVQGPAAAGNHIRVVSHNGPTQIQRAVFQDPNTQVFDVVNPPKPADRVINIRGSPAPPARVELVAEHQYAAPEVTVGGDEPQVQVVQAGVAASYATAAAPVVSKTVHAAPTVPTTYYNNVPAIATTYHHAAPAIGTTYHHAPAAVSYGAPNNGHRSMGYGNTVVLKKA